MRKIKLLGLLVLALSINLLWWKPSAEATPSGTTRVSVDASGNETGWGKNSDLKGITSSGEYVLFDSAATNLVAGDTNNKSDLFLKTRATGAIERVSVATGGTESNGNTNNADMSSDGRYVVFGSNATNLVGSDSNGQYDVFLRDTVNDTTEIVSIATGGTQGNNSSDYPRVSDDGRFVIFSSNASNLVASDTNSKQDTFLRDRLKNTTTRISVSENGTEANNHTSGGDISCDGRYIVVISLASNLVSGDTNGFQDIFLIDQLGGIVTNITSSANTASSNGTISCDGNTIVFSSAASNLVGGDTNGVADVYTYNRTSQAITRASLADDESEPNSDSASFQVLNGGQYVTFYSYATNLVASDTNSKADVFLRDTVNGTTERLSITSAGGQANDQSYRSEISRDGQYLAFVSEASNLVAGDTNSASDVFVINTGHSPVACY